MHLRIDRPRRSRSQLGFGMAEAMAATFVFTVGMAGVFTLQKVVIAGTASATDLAIASNLAGSALEQLHLSDYESVVGSSTCPPVATRDLACYFDKQGAVVASAADAYFTRTWSATPDVVAQVTDVAVQVVWQFGILSDAAGPTPHTITMNGRVYPR